MNDIIQKASRLIKTECMGIIEKPWLEDFLGYHMFPVIDFTRKLVREYKAAGEEIDEEIAELIAWLHDLGNISGGHEDHHITGAADAEKLLLGWGYPEHKILLVKHGILTHRSGQAAERQLAGKQVLEVECVARADMLAEITQVPSLFARALVQQQMDIKHTIDWISRKTGNIWRLLSAEDKLKVKDQYDAIQQILS